MIRFYFSQTAFFSSNLHTDVVKQSIVRLCFSWLPKKAFPSSRNMQACYFSFCGEEIILGACPNLFHEFVKGLYNYKIQNKNPMPPAICHLSSSQGDCKKTVNNQQGLNCGALCKSWKRNSSAENTVSHWHIRNPL